MVRKRRPVTADLELFELELGGEPLMVMSLPAAATAALDLVLSAAEVQVANDAATGLSNAAIGKKRSRSPRTVANQLASIYRKLGVASRAELAARLLERR